MSKTAIILGATGLTGNLLLQTLLADDRYGHVTLFSRSTCTLKHPKLTEYIVDLFQLEHYKDKFRADEVFCCIGTTKTKTSNKTIYSKIDYGIPVAAASLCTENGIETFVVISALGAKKKSKIFYNRIKGKMEAAVLEMNIKHTYILQPSLISGDREEKRIGESIMKFVMSMLKPILRLGDLKRYQPIHPQTIANCMVWVANNAYPSGRIKSKTIQEIGGDQ
ncbi:MAG TPA: NAD(P)H-binding protein [Aquaticitalea sp.]|nr:NAD(P)H-binding protein [Aquaticitalea sp.]